MTEQELRKLVIKELDRLILLSTLGPTKDLPSYYEDISASIHKRYLQAGYVKKSKLLERLQKKGMGRNITTAGGLKRFYPITAADLEEE
jgi:hypothetical protein